MQSNVPALDTGMFDHMSRIAKLMASSSLVPEHLNRFKRVAGEDVAMDPDEALANCFLVVNQAVRWQMDPFAVAQGVFVLKGRVGYEGKLIAAVINSHPLLTERLSYKFSGEGQARKVTVAGKIKGDEEAKTVDGSVSQWKTNNDSWTKITDQMLSYRGAREWARRHMPEAILGVYADEELEFEQQPRTIQGEVVVERSAGAALKTALAKPAPLSGEALQKAVSEASSALWSRSDEEGLSAYAEGLPEEVRGHEGFTLAFHRRLGEVRGAARPTAQGEAKPSEPVKQAAAEKVAGTPRMKKVYLERLAGADTDTLPVVLDETRAFLWPKEDADELLKAYEARKAALAQ